MHQTMFQDICSIISIDRSQAHAIISINHVPKLCQNMSEACTITSIIHVPMIWFKHMPCHPCYLSNYVPKYIPQIMYQECIKMCLKHVPKSLWCASSISHDIQNIPQIKCPKSPTYVSIHVPKTLQYMPQGIYHNIKM